MFTLEKGRLREDMTALSAGMLKQVHSLHVTSGSMSARYVSVQYEDEVYKHALKD